MMYIELLKKLYHPQTKQQKVILHIMVIKSNFRIVLDLPFTVWIRKINNAQLDYA